MRPALLLLTLAVVLGGCARLAMPEMPVDVPRWVPFLGTSAKPSTPPVASPVREPTGEAEATPKFGEQRTRTVDAEDNVLDRVVAVVNNDAITLGELQESILAYRAETRDRTGPSDEDLARDFLTRLIETRLQLQEADREKVTAEETEITDELNDRIKRFGIKSQAEFETIIKQQGLTIESIKRRVRDEIRRAKVVRRKVTLRVSVTEQEIDQYLETNRENLETGLAYHARHILVLPETPDDAAWEGARLRAEALRRELLGGADFAEMATAQSRDASARDGGDLGTLKRGELAQDIEHEILSLKAGQISRPYRSALGYHVFKLESKETLDGEGLERARQQIRDILFRQKYEVRLAAWLKEIKQRAIIEVRL
jgi:peptidyl-prolyl cis-trans isomerase SurA